MSDYISKSALSNLFEEKMADDKIMNPVIKILDVLEIIEDMPTIDEKEIIRKAFERVVTRLEEMKKNLVVNASSDYLAIHYALAIDSTIKAVKEEGGIE